MTKTNPAHESGMHDRKALDSCPMCETIRKAGQCAECGEKVATQGDVDRHAARHQSGTDTILGIVAKPARVRKPKVTYKGIDLDGDAPVVEVTVEGIAEPIVLPVESIDPPLVPEPEPITAEPIVAGYVPEPIPASGYPTREAWMLGAVEQMRPWMAEVGAPVGPVRISFGWPGGRGSKVGVRGQCWMPAAVKDGVPTIFISPDQTAEDMVTLLGIILHEMNHAAGHWGHTGAFAKTAAALGYEKPWTDSSGKNDDLKARLAALAERMGPMDHGAIKPETWLPGTRRLILDPTTGEPVQGGPKVQTTRMLKCECAECGYTVRTTRKWLDIATPKCPVDGGDMPAEEK